MPARGLRIVTDTTPGDSTDPGGTPGAQAVTVSLPAGTLGMLPLAPTAEERRWTTEALCASGDPDRLFVTGAAQREAAKLCRNCPVQMQCLADALDNQVEFGVWGGLTERQRRAVLKRRPDVVSWRALLEHARADARRGVAS